MTRDQIQQVGGFLQRCQLAHSPHVMSHWKAVEFRNLKKDWDTETARLLVQEDKPVILIYPVLDKYTLEAKAFCLLREFGNYLLLKAGSEMETHWNQKLVLPTSDQISAFQTRLNQGFKSYKDVVESLKTPTDRLIAIHLSNAMLANGQAFAGASNVKVREWGPTQEFANLNRFYSLTPLTSAYCPREVHEDFGAAFASCAVYDLKTTTHTAVRESLKQLIERIINCAR